MIALGFNFWTEWSLQEKVAFDGVNRLIIVYPHVTTLDIRKDVWSAWVRWHDMEARGYDRFFLAMERTGLETTPNGETGDQYFVRNNWRLVVDFSKVAITGVLTSRDFASAYFTPDLSIQFAVLVSTLVNTVTTIQNVISGTPGEIATAVWLEAVRTLTVQTGLSVAESARLMSLPTAVDNKNELLGTESFP